MQRTPLTLLSAVTLVAAFGLSGCAAGPVANPGPSRDRSATTSDVAPLPAPEVLTTIVATLADRSVPVDRKVSLLQFGTVDDGPVLQNFGEALAANGYAPLTVRADDLAWAARPGDVAATITLSAADPAVPPFGYPMTFTPVRDGWQLTRRSAEQFLPLAQGIPPG